MRAAYHGALDPQSAQAAQVENGGDVVATLEDPFGVRPFAARIVAVLTATVLSGVDDAPELVLHRLLEAAPPLAPPIRGLGCAT